MKNHWMQTALAGLLAAGLLVPAASGQVASGQEAAPPLPANVVPLRVTLQETGDQPRPSDYWIGIALGELPALAKQQLNLEHGLVVEDVLPDSPAAKALVQQYDVLVLAGEKELREPSDILKAVEEAKETELPIVVVRKGQRQTVRVTPARRPKPQSAETSPGDGPAHAALPQSALKKLEEALAELKGQDQLEILLARPGVVAHRLKVAMLPDNMSVSVSKEGDGPAKVHVKREGKEWTTTVDKLGELPEDVRSQVEQLLGTAIHPMLAARARAVVSGPQRTIVRGVAPPQAVLPKPVPPQPATTAARLHAYRVAESPAGLEAKLDQILKKLDALENKSLDQLQEEVKRLRKELDELRSTKP
jgi:hypothetical protein